MNRPRRAAVAAAAAPLLLCLAPACTWVAPASETEIDGKMTWMIEDVLRHCPLEGVEDPRVRTDHLMLASAELFQTGPDFYAGTR